MDQKYSADALAPVRSIPALSTDQLALAAFLLSRGHQPTLSVMPSGKVFFQFDASAALRDDVQAFHGGHALVEPTRFNSSRVELRRRMDVALGRGR